MKNDDERKKKNGRREDKCKIEKRMIEKPHESFHRILLWGYLSSHHKHTSHSLINQTPKP